MADVIICHFLLYAKKTERNDKGVVRIWDKTRINCKNITVYVIKQCGTIKKCKNM